MMLGGRKPIRKRHAASLCWRTGIERLLRNVTVLSALAFDYTTGEVHPCLIQKLANSEPSLKKFKDLFNPFLPHLMEGVHDGIVFCWL